MAAVDVDELEEPAGKAAGGYESEEEVDSEAVELVVCVPARVSADGVGIECLTPAFKHPCEVTIEVVVDGVEVVPGSQQYWFYGTHASDMGAAAQRSSVDHVALVVCAQPHRQGLRSCATPCR